METRTTIGQCEPSLCSAVQEALDAKGRLAAGIVMLLCDAQGGCVDGKCPLGGTLQQDESVASGVATEEGAK